jgi:N-acetylmuramoyl-L-alanine amidase
MKKLFSVIFFLVFLSPTGGWGELVSSQNTSFPSPTRFNQIRHQVYPTHTRVVMDFDLPPLYTLRKETDSGLISVRFSKTLLGETLKETPVLLLQGVLERIDVKEEAESQQVVLTLTFRSMQEHKVMALKNPHRLVLDVYHPPIEEKEPESEIPSVSLTPPPSVAQGIQTIVIDPGHGGEMPGAVGPTGLTEADVVLDVSLRLKKLVEEKLGKRVVMTRSRDITVTLKERTELANQIKADLFVSVHANASTRRAAQGIETYLFGRATDERALQTAARENATDLKSAKNFQEVILNDLLRDFTINEALELAHYTQDAFEKTLIPDYPTPSLGVKKAPFYVLAHTNMPAILAEISFVSNKVEEKRLRQGAYRQRISESIFKGLKEYIEEKEK